MRAVRSAALLTACFIWTINAQSSHNNSYPGNNNQGNSINPIDSNQKQQQASQLPKGSVFDVQISFNTKAKDACSMIISSQANFTKLRVSCKSKGNSYWCDFRGKPNVCKAYNNNPRRFFSQMMWDLKKLHNACQGPRVYKPQMCRLASDDAQMSFHASWPKISKTKPTQASRDRNENQQKQQTKFSSSTPKPVNQQPKPQQPAKPAAKPAKTAVSKTVSLRKPVKIATARPTVAEQENDATKLAEEYCWSSLQGVCSYFISWFQN